MQRCVAHCIPHVGEDGARPICARLSYDQTYLINNPSDRRRAVRDGLIMNNILLRERVASAAFIPMHILHNTTLFPTSTPNTHAVAIVAHIEIIPYCCGV